jgi:hypothetical protein
LWAYHADGVLSGETLAQHLAAAFERPAVCLLSGFLPGSWVWYSGVTYIPQMLHCLRDKSVCWCSRVVPLGGGDSKDRDSVCYLPLVRADETVPKCMAIIAAEEVANDFLGYSEGGRPSPSCVCPAALPRAPRPGPRRRLAWIFADHGFMFAVQGRSLNGVRAGAAASPHIIFIRHQLGTCIPRHSVLKPKSYERHRFE